jgi:hypothetical protein
VSKIDVAIRNKIELAIDNMLKDPQKVYDEISTMLSKQGIEPDLDAILSAISGYFWGRVKAEYLDKFKRDLNEDEKTDFNELMGRRAWELREAFMGSLFK